MTIENAYNSCLENMYGLHRFGIILGLETIARMLKSLGEPHKSYATIHVAGSNGKGSVASAIATVLRKAGYKVGLYTSPHLVKFNERISVDGKHISDEDVVMLCDAVKQADYGERQPTFFEYTTAMALYHFSLKKVDFAVLETGMGGRMDATNVVKPKVSVITNISLEHQAYLGKKLTDIAFEKAGIIKNDTPVVTAVSQKSVIDVMKKVAAEKNAPFLRLGDAFKVRKNKSNSFNYYGMDLTVKDVELGLLGSHQIENASLVLAACEILTTLGADIPVNIMTEGIKKNRWPGRLDVYGDKPKVVLDGAHSLMAVRRLCDYLYNECSDKKITLVMGILDDKPYKGMLKNILPLASRLILTRPKIDRGIPTDILYKTAKELISDVRVVPDVGTALKEAIDISRNDDSVSDEEKMVCVAGSLYVVGEAMEALEKMGYDMT